MRRSFVSPIIKKLARKAGVKLVLEPSDEYAGQIELPDGRKRYFYGTSLDLNPHAASEIAKDKASATFFMKRLGYRVIEGDSFFTTAWRHDEAYRYACELGFPVIVKPNALSQGAGVCKVYNKREFLRAVGAFSKRDRVFLVQRAVVGRDYRIVVLDSEVVCAYERTPLSVIGDGRSSVERLVTRKQQNFEKTGRDTVIRMDDFRILGCLRRLGLSMKSVPKLGERIPLLDNANLSTGGDAVDVTDSIHESFSRLAVRLTKDLGLRFCGVDLIVQGSACEPCEAYWVIEVNAAPGLHHYATIGRRQKRIVDGLYWKVLQAMKDSL
jgi:D-alanine-D-alanine ligase-like ATP-grasp enzyme